MADSEKIISRYLDRTAAEITTRWMKDRIDLLKRTLKIELRDGADTWSYQFNDEMEGYFNRLEKDFRDLVINEQARISFADRVDGFKTYAKTIVEKLETIRNIERKHYDFDTSEGYLRWAAVLACLKKMQAGAKTIGDLYKYSWVIDEDAIENLIRKTLRKATPEQKASLVDPPGSSGAEDNKRWRIKHDFLQGIKYEDQATKAIKKTKLDNDPIKRVEFVFGVLETSYSEKVIEREDAYREFDFKGMKVVIDDNTVDNYTIPKYIKLLDQAHQMLRAKRLESAWYGTFFVKCQECGGKSKEAEGQVAGHYHIGPDTVSCYIRPQPFVVELIAHELGHRYWFKQMKPEQRVRFKALVKARTIRRPKDAVKIKLIKGTQEINGVQTALRNAVNFIKDPNISRWDLTRFLSKMIDASHFSSEGTLTPGVAISAEAANEDDVKFAQKNLQHSREQLFGMLGKADPASDDVFKAKIQKAFEDFAQESIDSIKLAVEAHNTFEQAKLENHPDTKKWLDSYSQNPATVDAVSDYGQTNIDEAFAEVFAHYVMNKDMTRDQLESFKSVLNKGHGVSRLASKVSQRFVIEKKR